MACIDVGEANADMAGMGVSIVHIISLSNALKASGAKAGSDGNGFRLSGYSWLAALGGPRVCFCPTCSVTLSFVMPATPDAVFLLSLRFARKLAGLNAIFPISPSALERRHPILRSCLPLPMPSTKKAENMYGRLPHTDLHEDLHERSSRARGSKYGR
jgi:hypothetical protein